MIDALFIALCAAANRARGSKVFGLTDSTAEARAVFSVTVALASLAIGAGLWQMLIIFAGLFAWSVPGWGKYFSAIHGRDNPQEKEIGWIDDIGYNTVFGVDHESNRRRGAICMGLRGVYMLPMFLALAWFNPWALLIAPLCLLQGIPYYLAGYYQREPVMAAELAWGACIGLMIMGAL